MGREAVSEVPHGDGTNEAAAETGADAQGPEFGGVRGVFVQSKKVGGMESNRNRAGECPGSKECNETSEWTEEEGHRVGGVGVGRVGGGGGR